jgi:hypothetical protein
VSTSLSADYRLWMAAHPDTAKAAAAPVMTMVAYTSPRQAPAKDHGEFGTWFDEQMRANHLAAFRPWTEPADAAPLVPTADDWAAHVTHIVRTAGPDHAGIGLDLVGGRSCVPADASGYPDLLSALSRSLDPHSVLSAPRVTRRLPAPPSDQATDSSGYERLINQHASV